MSGRPARRVGTAEGPPGEADLDLLAVLVPTRGPLEGPAAAADGWLEGALSRCREQEAFRGKEDETFLLPAGGDDRPHVLAVGAGEGETTPDRLRRAGGLAVRHARRHRLASAGLWLPAGTAPGDGTAVQAAAEGLVLGDWSFDELRDPEAEKSPPPPPERVVVGASSLPAGAAAAADRGAGLARAQNWTRGLVARPGNVATPSFLAARAEETGGRFGLDVEVWGPDRMRREGFGAHLAVARGSDQEPRFLILRHEGADESPAVLVGKGVTFDSGGISLKPSKGMEEMKYDMAGGAAVLGALRAAADLGLERRVVGLVPCAENLPSGRALKPGDVVRGVSGTSIEVVNTDAEGRLLLSDALAYAHRLDPGAVVDLATLTGSCVVALGHHAAGLMSPDDGLAEALLAAGRRTGERLWRLPLWDEYRGQLDSEVADIKNSGDRSAGAITAGKFLQEFVGEAPWAHLDVAGTAWSEEDRPYQPEGATGMGVRLLVEWLRSG